VFFDCLKRFRKSNDHNEAEKKGEEKGWRFINREKAFFNKLDLDLDSFKKDLLKSGKRWNSILVDKEDDDVIISFREECEEDEKLLFIKDVSMSERQKIRLLAKDFKIFKIDVEKKKEYTKKEQKQLFVEIEKRKNYKEFEFSQEAIEWNKVSVKQFLLLLEKILFDIDEYLSFFRLFDQDSKIVVLVVSKKCDDYSSFLKDVCSLSKKKFRYFKKEVPVYFSMYRLSYSNTMREFFIVDQNRCLENINGKKNNNDGDGSTNSGRLW
jgi:hypothetical protein